MSKKVNKVVIYKIDVEKSISMGDQGITYSLEPWGQNTDRIEGSDNGGREYVLPEGFSVAVNSFDRAQIYDRNDRPCEITSGGKYKSYPVLVDGNWNTFKLESLKEPNNRKTRLDWLGEQMGADYVMAMYNMTDREVKDVFDKAYSLRKDIPND